MYSTRHLHLMYLVLNFEEIADFITNFILHFYTTNYNKITI
jgi:hypothetical protein